MVNLIVCYLVKCYLNTGIYNANFIFKNAALFCNDKKLVIVLLIIQHAPIHLLRAICFNNLLEGLHFRALQIN